MSSRFDFLNQQLLLVDGQYAKSRCAKHKKMAQSPFVFFRGTAQIFYADLAAKNLPFLTDFLNVPLCNVMGDCHTSNFGFFTEEGSHSEQVVFSINDFDDACVGYAYWDILRYLVSLHLAIDHCRGVQSKEYVSSKPDKDYQQKILVDEAGIQLGVQAFIKQYIEILEQVSLSPESSSSVLQASFDDFSAPSVLQKRFQKAECLKPGSENFLLASSLAKAVDLSVFPLKFKPIEEKFNRQNINFHNIQQNLGPYFYQGIVDAVNRVNSGTGSVNMGRLYLLVGPKQHKVYEGDEYSTNQNNVSEISRYHVVEVKQQRTAAALHYFPNLHQQNQLNPAHLTVKCQRSMQRRSDPFLDEAFFDDEHWLIRSRHHAKVGIDPEHIGFGKKNALEGGFGVYAGACGEELARAHCRTDLSSNEFEIQMLKALKNNSQALSDIAREYAQQVKQDWQWLVDCQC